MLDRILCGKYCDGYSIKHQSLVFVSSCGFHLTLQLIDTAYSIYSVQITCKFIQRNGRTVLINNREFDHIQQLVTVYFFLNGVTLVDLHLPFQRQIALALNTEAFGLIDTTRFPKDTFIFRAFRLNEVQFAALSGQAGILSRSIILICRYDIHF